MSSKYERLSSHLASLRLSRWTAEFKEIVELGCHLPPSAYRHPEWWSNTAHGHTQTKGWLPVGWRTCQVDLTRQTVTFFRHDLAGDEEQAVALVPPVRPINHGNGLTIPEAKAALSVAYHVPPENIEIIIRG